MRERDRQRDRERETATWSINKEKNMLPDGKWDNSRLQPLEAKASTLISDIVFLSKYGDEPFFDWH